MVKALSFLKKYYLAYVLLFAFFAGAAIWIFGAEKSLPTSALRQDEDICAVVIDPGHGGEDGGAVSPNGCRESTLNLQIGLRLDALLHFVGVPTVMTRREETSIYDASAQTVAQKKVSDLKNRAALVNAVPNALLLSIHQNMYSESRYSGAQVFYAKTEGSDRLAERLQTLLRENADPSNHREAKQSDAVWLMEHINCTGVLVECGFLSNAEEEQRLKSETYQKKLTCVIACGLTQYLSEETQNDEV